MFCIYQLICAEIQSAGKIPGTVLNPAAVALQTSPSLPPLSLSPLCDFNVSTLCLFTTSGITADLLTQTNKNLRKVEKNLSFCRISASKLISDESSSPPRSSFHLKASPLSFLPPLLLVLLYPTVPVSLRQPHKRGIKHHESNLCLRTERRPSGLTYNLLPLTFIKPLNVYITAETTHRIFLSL